jgi:hypothetical protein
MLAFRRLGFELNFPDRFCIRPVRQLSLRTGFLLFGVFLSEEAEMADDPVATAADKRGLTLDWWAVLLALVLALLVRVGLLQHIPW